MALHEPHQRDLPMTRRTFLSALTATGGAALGLPVFGQAAATTGATSSASNRAAALEAPLANPIEELRASYGIVVVGSGYGGAIAAARLAGRTSVCLLERGREWAPGMFPDTIAGFRQQLHTPRQPLGLYDYQTHDEVDVFVGCGLGGTSLINANVVLAPDDALFDHPRWPVELRQDRDRGVMESYYALVREMLQVERYPADQPPLRKSDALRQSCEARGVPFITLDLAVNFTRVDDQPNPLGVHQRRCTLCGDCVSGCNVGAKNTLAMNYLPLAKQHGVQMFTQTEVSHVVPWPAGGFVVHYVYHPGDGQPARPGVVHARGVILAAGALGTPQLLLRSRDYGLVLSETLGHYFSANADVLGCGYNTDRRTDVLGFGARQDERAQLLVGPTITAMADYRQRSEPQARFILQEGAIPRMLVDTLRLLMPTLARTGENTDAGVADQWREARRITRDLRGYDPQGALNHSMVYLGMGHDDADGTLVLNAEGQVRLLWANAREQSIFKTIDAEMQAHAGVLGGTYVQNKARDGGPKLITVHPVGGCIMGADAEHGVVDHRGRVYDPSQGATAVHAGLYIADGSILPTSVGCNPLLTIAALAERIAALINADRSLDLTPLP